MPRAKGRRSPRSGPAAPASCPAALHRGKALPAFRTSQVSCAKSAGVVYGTSVPGEEDGLLEKGSEPPMSGEPVKNGYITENNGDGPVSSVDKDGRDGS